MRCWLGALVAIGIASSPCDASAQAVGHWVRHMDRSDVPAPGWLGRIVELIAGRKTDDPFRLPFDISADRGNLLMLSRATNGISIVDWRSGKVEVVGKGQDLLRSPVSITGSREHYFVSDPDQSSVFVCDGGKLRLLLDSTQGLVRPTGLALDGKRGRLWVVDTGRHQVCCFDTTGTQIMVIGERGEGDEEFNYPTFVAVAADGAIIVNDSMNGAVKKFDAEGRLVWSIGGPASDPPVFDRAKGVAVDENQRVFVVDNLRDCVIALSADGEVLGTLGGPGVGAGEMWSPVGIAVAGDTLIVADTQNHRLTLFALDGGGQ